MGVAAVGVATCVAGVAATQPGSIAASLVDLTALIVVGSSTNPSGAGVENFFQGKFRDPMYTGPNGDDIVHVNFFDGPAGIQAALEANAGERNAIITSGWGAANASLLLLARNPAFSDTVVILDNDVARPDGGFGTRYPWFALIGVNPIPTPSQVPALRAVNIGYEYDYNSNAPAYVLNPFAAVNSLAAYLNTRLNQAEIDLPVNPDGTPSVTCNANTCAITRSGAVLDCPDARCSSPGDRITAYVTTRNNTTYVTYTTSELPLTSLIRTYLGDYIADVVNPLLELVVNFGYYGGNPIPTDPSAYRPAAFIPSPGDVLTTLAKIPQAIEETVAAALGPLQPKRLPSTSRIERTTDPAESSIAEQLTQAAEVVGVSGYLQSKTPKQPKEPTEPKATNKPLMNVVRDSMKVKPGRGGGDDDNGRTDSTTVEHADGSSAGQPTDPPQRRPDSVGAQTNTGTGSNDGGGTGSHSGGSADTDNDTGGAAAA
jgi:hypothetical protein